jgi:hypothetical protein
MLTSIALGQQKEASAEATLAWERRGGFSSAAHCLVGLSFSGGAVVFRHWAMTLGFPLIVFSIIGSAAESKSIKVAVVRSWPSGTDVVLPVINELNNSWSSYGTTPLTIDTSLKNVASFTYQDLMNTQADVLWLSDPAGGMKQYSATEIDAIGQYVNEGHSILGTFAVFQYTVVQYPGQTERYDNRGLAPIFGLRSDITYSSSEGSAMQAFNILAPSELFRSLPDPYVTSGYAMAQVPADDLHWDAEDLGAAQLVARSEDNCGVITWYETDSYHAIYVSEMIEYNGSSSDTQFLYNALTIPEPSALALLGVSAFGLLAYGWRRRRA